MARKAARKVIAGPKTLEVILPTHTTLDPTLFSMSPTPFAHGATKAAEATEETKHASSLPSSDNAHHPEYGSISMPYFGATARSLSISSWPKGGGEDLSVAFSPTSSRNSSTPAGVTNTSILADVLPTFLKV